MDERPVRERDDQYIRQRMKQSSLLLQLVYAYHPSHTYRIHIFTSSASQLAAPSL